MGIRGGEPSLKIVFCIVIFYRVYVDFNLAKVGVVSSNLIARSRKNSIFSVLVGSGAVPEMGPFRVVPTPVSIDSRAAFSQTARAPFGCS